MTFGLLPVKAPQNAKQRLSSVLGPEQREALARLLYEETLEVLRAARGLDRIAVVTSDVPVADHARRAGVLVFEEREQRGHSQSADAAARYAMELGAETVLMVPIDVPLATPAEIEGLVAEADAGVIVVPSADGTGTNALVRTPPDAIECCFGQNSFRAHLEQARTRGIAIEVRSPPGLVFDVDTPEDLMELLARAPASRTAELLRSTGLWRS